ncbi:MAG: hypothetical protein AAF928_22040 [Myxococcota bacterium]
MNKYGLEVGQLSAHGAAAVRAAERSSARTIVYRDDVPVAAIVPFDELRRLDPADPAEDAPDPLLSLCGTCDHDDFVASMSSDLIQTALFRRRSR